jgi:hypothetical protein
MEGAAEWTATGLENQGEVTLRGSIPPPSSEILGSAQIVMILELLTMAANAAHHYLFRSTKFFIKNKR